MKKLFFLAVLTITALSCERENENVTPVQEKTTANGIFRKNSDSTETIDSLQQAQPPAGFAPVDPKDINPPRR